MTTIQSKKHLFLLLCPKKDLPFYSELKGLIDNSGFFDVVDAADAPSAVKAIGTAPLCVVVSFISSTQDFLTSVGLAKQVAKLRKKTRMLLYGINVVKNTKIDPILLETGFRESFHLPLGITTFGSRLKKDLQKISDQSIAFNFTAKSKTNEVKSRNPLRPSEKFKSRESESAERMSWVEAVEHNDDCWIVKKSKDVKKTREFWVLDVMGPGPSIGDWESASAGSSGSADSLWVLRGKRGVNHRLMPKGGYWIFRGNQPRFVWLNSQWRFIGRNPSLSLHIEGKPEIYRFQTKNKCLQVSRNSAIAKGRMSAIEESISQFGKNGEKVQKESPVNTKVLKGVGAENYGKVRTVDTGEDTSYGKVKTEEGFVEESSNSVADEDLLAGADSAVDWQSEDDDFGEIAREDVDQVEDFGKIKRKSKVANLPDSELIVDNSVDEQVFDTDDPFEKLDLKAKVTLGKTTASAKVVEYSGESLVLLVESRAFSKGSVVMVEISASQHTPAFQIPFQATIRTFTPAEAASCLIELHYDKATQMKLQRLDDLLNSHQTNLTSFLKAAKGV